MRIFFIIFLLCTVAGPISMILGRKIDFNADYRTANRDSAHIAPDPNITSEAIVQVYKARAFNWRGMFAVHVWIATKERNAKQYTVYQVIGWRLFRGLPPLMVAKDIPDRYWFNQKPELILDIRADQAEAMIPKIAHAAGIYPYPNQYTAWPGPNSNTFPAYIARQIPEMKLILPSNAVGKDFLPDSAFFSLAPSHTGYQFSWHGMFGIMLAVQEGLEINLLGLVYGFSPVMMIIKLPGFGDIKLI